MVYKTKDVCCREIRVEVDNGIITEIEFIEGCNGNLKGLAALAVGRTTDEVINTLGGIKCKHRDTSCPDQLAIALSS